MAPVATSFRDFEHLDVLIDSHDLSLLQGTGIRSYGLNLIDALKSLGGNPELLVNAGDRDLRVTDLAMKWGFTHLGRFSRAYKEFFGELPSTQKTLRRSE